MFINLSMADSAIDFIQTVLENWNENYKKVVDVLTTSPETLYPDAWATMGIIAGYLSSIGAALLIVFFYVGITKTTLHFEDLRRPERFIGPVVRLIIGEALVINGYTLSLKVLEIFQGTILGIFNLVNISSTDGQISLVPDEIVQQAAKLGTGSSLLVLIMAVLMGAIIWLLSIVLLLTVYVRFFKIYIYAAVSPIPLSSIAGENTTRIARSFLINYFGVCFQGILIIIAFILFKSIAVSGYVVDPNKDAVDNLLGYMGTIMLQMILLVVTVRGTERLTKEMIGG